MAVAIRLRAPSATRDDYDAFDSAIGEWVTAHGGQAEGFMSYAAYAGDEGFDVLTVWRNEHLWQAWWDGTMRQLGGDVGIAIEFVGSSSVWGFATR